VIQHKKNIYQHKTVRVWLYRRMDPTYWIQLVRVSQTLKSLEVYMVVNFRTRGICRYTRKLTQILTLIKKMIFIYICKWFARKLVSKSKWHTNTELKKNVFLNNLVKTYKFKSYMYYHHSITLPIDQSNLTFVFLCLQST
jgi:hypothetical protein